MFSHCSDFIYNAWNCARIEREEKEEERREKTKFGEKAFAFRAQNLGFFGLAISGCMYCQRSVGK